MCVKFRAHRLFYVVAPVVMIGHDGVASVNEDFPVGTVLCYDKNDNLYCYIGPGQSDAPKTADCWPVAERQGIELYRDYWRHIASGSGTPYGDSIRNAQVANIVECL